MIKTETHAISVKGDFLGFSTKQEKNIIVRKITYIGGENKTTFEIVLKPFCESNCRFVIFP